MKTKTSLIISKTANMRVKIKTSSLTNLKKYHSTSMPLRKTVPSKLSAMMTSNVTTQPLSPASRRDTLS